MSVVLKMRHDPPKGLLCIDDSGGNVSLTIGRIYLIIPWKNRENPFKFINKDYSDTHWLIRDDSGDVTAYMKFHFKEL